MSEKHVRIDTYTAGEALAKKRRVKIKTGTTTNPPEVIYADAGEEGIGFTDYAQATSGGLVAVVLDTAEGTREVTAADSFAIGASLYAAADGKVSDTSNGSSIGKAKEAATADGDIIEMVPHGVKSTTAGTVSIADAGGFTATATVEAALQEIYQSLLSAQGFIPISLTQLREVASNDIQALAAHGGILAKDSTPILEYTNGDTDSALRLNFDGGDVNPVVLQVPLPPDLDVTADLVLHIRAAMEDTNDTPTIASDTYFNEGDTKVEDASAAITGTAYAEYTITIATADIPAGAQTVTIELTPGTHDTDALFITALWLEYTKTLLSS